VETDTTKAPLPPVSEAVAHAVAEWLQGHEQMQRTPTGTAKVLTLAVLLHRKKQPWPTRQEVADHLEVSRPLVDMVVSQRSATGHLKVVKGVVAKCPSRERHIVPSHEVIQAVTVAEEKTQ
jgi:hypothetical protein